MAGRIAEQRAATTPAQRGGCRPAARAARRSAPDRRPGGTRARARVSTSVPASDTLRHAERLHQPRVHALRPRAWKVRCDPLRLAHRHRAGSAAHAHAGRVRGGGSGALQQRLRVDESDAQRGRVPAAARRPAKSLCCQQFLEHDRHGPTHRSGRRASHGRDARATAPRSPPPARSRTTSPSCGSGRTRPAWTRRATRIRRAP